MCDTERQRPWPSQEERALRDKHVCPHLHQDFHPPGLKGNTGLMATPAHLWHFVEEVRLQTFQSDAIADVSLLRVEGFISAHRFRAFSPWLARSRAVGLRLFSQPQLPLALPPPRFSSNSESLLGLMHRPSPRGTTTSQQRHQLETKRQRMSLLWESLTSKQNRKLCRGSMVNGPAFTLRFRCHHLKLLHSF